MNDALCVKSSQPCLGDFERIGEGISLGTLADFALALDVRIRKEQLNLEFGADVYVIYLFGSGFFDEDNIFITHVAEIHLIAAANQRAAFIAKIIVFHNMQPP